MLDLRLEGSRARLRISRPEVHNAIDIAGWRAIGELARKAVDQGARALILSGTPDGPFSAGADLHDIARLREDEAGARDFLMALRGGIDTLAALPIPTVALVEGACYGGAVALALACDIRIAGPSGRFAVTPAKLGIGYPQEDVHGLVALVGPGQAARLLLSAEAIDAAEALRIGLVEMVEADAERAAIAWAEAAVGKDAASIAMLKAGIALAVSGKRSDEDQDRRFLDLLASDAVASRLAGLRGT